MNQRHSSDSSAASYGILHLLNQDVRCVILGHGTDHGNITMPRNAGIATSRYI